MIPDSIVPWLAIAALLVALLSLVVAFVLFRRVNRLGHPAQVPLAAAEPDLGALMERVDRLGLELSAQATRLAAAESQGAQSMQRIGVVRYNPFEDTGSNQSFVLALLDAHGDGFVLSTLHSRQATRVFLKSVAQGRTETALSEEEAQAIRIASG